MARTDCVIVEYDGWKHKKANEIIKDLKSSLSNGGEPQPWKKVVKIGYSRGRVEVHFAPDQSAEMDSCTNEWKSYSVDGKPLYRVTAKVGGANQNTKRPAGNDLSGDQKKQKAGELPNLYMLVRDKKKNVVYGQDESSIPTLSQRTVPLVEYSYEEQMKMKSGYARTIGKLMTKEVFEQCRKANRHGKDSTYPAWAFTKWQRGVPIEYIVECPENFRTEYRNKMEFTIGHEFQWETKTFDTSKSVVGFVRGNHQFEPIVESPNDLIHIPNVSKTIIDRFVKALNTEDSDLTPVIRKDLASVAKGDATDRGHLRLLQIRTFSNDDEDPQKSGGQVMITLLAYGNPTSDHGKSVFKKAKNFVISLFGEGKNNLGDNWFVGSIYVAQNTQANDVLTSADFSECVFGENTLQQHLMGMKFEVTPFSFFQTNIGSTKELYMKALKWATDGVEKNANKKVILFDICCGTGTIGLIGHHLLQTMGVDSHVIGVDCVKEAIASAVRNTELNKDVDQTKFEWIADYVENVFSSILDKEQDKIETLYDDIICIVDPPRGGLHQKVLKALRNISAIKRVIYISCNPESLIKDGLTLCSSPSMMFGAEALTNESRIPFYPAKAVPVDMFPHTLHTEMVVEFKRTPVDQYVRLNEKGFAITEGDEADAKSDIPLVDDNQAKEERVNPLLQ